MASGANSVNVFTLLWPLMGWLTCPLPGSYRIWLTIQVIFQIESSLKKM